MPGLVVRVLVEAGQPIEQGQGAVILEAMKMENEIRSPRPGVVKSVNVVPGTTVNLGDALFVVADE
jgi:biotin carboxyl carrier protein